MNMRSAILEERNDLYGYYPEDIGEVIEKLHKTVLKHLKFSADIDYFYILREIKYVKEGVNNGSKDK